MTTSLVENATASGNGAANLAQEGRVRDMRVEVKKVVTTHDGKLQVALESEALSTEMLERIRQLMAIQHGVVLASFEPAQSARDG